MQLKVTIKDGQIVYEDKRFAKELLERLEGRKLLLDLNTETKTRTDLQNRSLHLYFTQLADALNDAGFDLKKVIRVDVPWSPYAVKEYLWRPMQKAMFGKKSTKQLTTMQIDEIYTPLDRTIAERTGVHVAWPSIESLLNE